MSLDKTSGTHCQAFLTKGKIFFFFQLCCINFFFEDRHPSTEGLTTVVQDYLVLMVNLVRRLDQDTLKSGKACF